MKKEGKDPILNSSAVVLLFSNSRCSVIRLGIVSMQDFYSKISSPNVFQLCRNWALRSFVACLVGCLSFSFPVAHSRDWPPYLVFLIMKY